MGLFERDYIMRQIEDFARMLAKLFLHKDTIWYEPPAESRYSQTDFLHRQLCELVGEGKLNQAENLLFEKLDPQDTGFLELAIDFYMRLDQLDDQYLEEHDFSREEIYQGLQDAARVYGVELPRN